jgi:3-hydroxyisobutyrate dehydrogenase-like beta-hydroxyacid dehydrogenase
MSERVYGFLGLGNMGSPMAANIAAAGFEVVGYDAAGTKDRRPDGVHAADSIGEVVARADTVLLSVPDGRVTLAIADQIAGATDRRVAVVIDLSTVGPVAASRGRRAIGGSRRHLRRRSGIRRSGGSEARTISLMFGGPTEVFEPRRARQLAGNVFHVGEEAGQGQAMKLLNNFLSATALAATSEAFALGQAFGLDLETMLDVVNVSTGRNSATYDKFPNRVLTGTYDTGFHTRLMAKDVRLFNSVAGETGTLHEVSHAVGSVWNAAEDAMPASDFSEIWKYVPIARG